MKAIPAIKRFFEAEPNGRKVTMDELKNLGHEDRQELGALACEALGEEFESSPAMPEAKAA